MALMTTQQAVSGGLLPVYSAVASPDTLVADGRTALHVKNGSGASITATVTSRANAGAGLAQANNVVTIPAGSERLISIDQVGFADPTNGGLATVTYSATATITSAALRI